MTTSTYKSFEITPVSGRLANQEWSVNVLISKHYETHSMRGTYSDSKTFKTKNEADFASTQFAKEIIDGIHQGLSTDDL